MLQQLSLDEFLKLAKTAKRVSVYREILADKLTPVNIIERLPDEMKAGVVLESGLFHDDARYSFIAFQPIAQLLVEQDGSTQTIGDCVTHFKTHPFAALRTLMQSLDVAHSQNAVDFVNGAVGFITYDAVRLFEPIPDRHQNEKCLPLAQFNFYETTLMFDHLKQTLLINMIVEVTDAPVATYENALAKINALINKMNLNPAPAPALSTTKVLDDDSYEMDINDETFKEMVARAKDYIIAGDAFQIVLSRTFTKKFTAKPLDIYRALRRITPAPYMFYLPILDGVLVGASPEKLLSVQNRKVTVNPIAGTRRRDQDTDDEAISRDLLTDKKELAEHTMLVDLARNDVGKVAKPGTVKVSEFLQVKHYSHVSHITSTVTGELADNQDAFDALAATFPAGTLSGAPKIRAMQIIDELETSKRGLYGGAICRIDYQGNLDSCIAIRMAYLHQGLAHVRTGAGIVYDSNPESEANETKQKAAGVLAAMSSAEGQSS